MTQPETPTRTEFNQAAQRCAAAYHQVKAQLPKGAFSWSTEGEENQHKAFLAFAAELPLLIDPPSFQLYLTCIGQGVTIGAIDPVDAGRFCHIANTAMAAWKLPNLIIPAAEAKERAAQQKAQKQPFPPEESFSASQNPSPVDKDLQFALSQLPGWESQKQQFKSLRKRGISLPSDDELRQNPFAALYFCQTAEWFLRKDAEAQPASQPVEKQSTPLPPKGNHSAGQDDHSAGRPQPQEPIPGQKQGENAPPLPPKGNHPEDESLPYDDWESLYAATKLPAWEEQVKLFQSLRDRGQELPTDEELRDHPADALRLCETAQYFQKAQQPAAQPPRPEPVKEQPSEKKEPPAQAA